MQRNDTNVSTVSSVLTGEESGSEEGEDEEGEGSLGGLRQASNKAEGAVGTTNESVGSGGKKTPKKTPKKKKGKKK